MSRKAQMLARLAKLAEIRSDAELKRFAAFRKHVDTLKGQQTQQQVRLAHLFAQDEPFSVEGARLASQDAGRIAREIGRLEAELARIKPGFDVARGRAVREFGRVRALEHLIDGLSEEAKKAERKL